MTTKTIYLDPRPDDAKMAPIPDIFKMSARDLFDYQRQEYIDNCIIPTIVAFDLPVKIVRLSEFRFVVYLDAKTVISCALSDFYATPVSFYDGGKYALFRDRQLFRGINMNLQPLHGPEYETREKIPYMTSRTSDGGFGLEARVCLVDNDGMQNPYDWDFNRLYYKEDTHGASRYLSSESFYQDILRFMAICEKNKK